MSVDAFLPVEELKRLFPELPQGAIRRAICDGDPAFVPVGGAYYARVAEFRRWAEQRLARKLAAIRANRLHWPRAVDDHTVDVELLNSMP